MGLKSLFRKARRGFMLRVLLHITKGLATGKYGKVPQKVWNALAGFKTWTGVIFVAVGYGFQTAHGAGLCPDCPEYSNILMAVGAVLAQVGLLDAANREEGPKE
jgi:hypothetical protein